MENTWSEITDTDEVYRLESNIDDCSGELLGYVMGILMEAGAKDVSYTPLFMKKNRPAYQLNVICAPEDVRKLETIIFEETTTIGIRKMKMERTILKRRPATVQTSLGAAAVKECTLPSGKKRYYPEYEDAVRLAKENGIPLQDAFGIIRKACDEQVSR